MSQSITLDKDIMELVMSRNLKDTPFALERLFVWAVGVYGLIGVFTIAVLSVLQKTIPPQLQSLTMFCIGALVARIEKRIK